MNSVESLARFYLIFSFKNVRGIVFFIIYKLVWQKHKSSPCSRIKKLCVLINIRHADFHFLFISSSERYNPITGAPIPEHPTRPNSSAIFGVSPSSIEYIFIHPSETTRPTLPDTTERRRSLSRESLRRSHTSSSRLDSDECSSISDVSECSWEAEHRERTRTNSGTFSKARKPASRSASSRLPVGSSLKPPVMKRAHSFTRGTEACVPRGQFRYIRGSTNSAKDGSSSTSEWSSTQRDTSEVGSSSIATKPASRNVGSQIQQSSRLPLKRADVSSNRDRSDKENNAKNNRTTTADSKISGIPRSTSKKQVSNESKEPHEHAMTKESMGSGISVKGIIKYCY